MLDKVEIAYQQTSLLPWFCKQRFQSTTTVYTTLWLQEKHPKAEELRKPAMA